MTELWIYRGLPGSGKSAEARKWVSADPLHRAEVNRHWLRLAMHGGYVSRDTERLVTTARDAMIAGLLNRGTSVVSSDTNLPQRTARDIARIGRLHGASVCVRDFTSVPLDTCLARNSLRTDKAPAPEDAIRQMHSWYVTRLKGRPLPFPDEPPDEPYEDEPYVPVPGTPEADITDQDGTLSLVGDRSPFDESRVHEDHPNEPVIAALAERARAGRKIIVVSGRSEKCRAATEEWHARYVLPHFPVEALHMRPAGDERKDYLVKRDIFNERIRYRYTVRAVWDDRTAVVKFWRSIGLLCLQVAAGDFLWPFSVIARIAENKLSTAVIMRTVGQSVQKPGAEAAVE